MTKLLHRYSLVVLGVVLGISLMSCTYQMKPPLQDVWGAIEAGDQKVVKQFLDQGVDPNASRVSDNRLPLMHATLHQEPEVVELLIEHGADVNTSDSVGNSCLIIASFLGAADTVEVLISNGADLFRRNISGEDAMQVLGIDWRMTQYYANEIYGLGVTWVAVSAGRERVRAVLEKAQEQAAEQDVWVALMLDRLDLVKQHVEKVDDIDAIVSSEGSPILVAASVLGRTHVLEYLLDAEANIEARDVFGSTSLLVAALFGHEDIVKILIERDADLFTENYQGTDLIEALALDWNFTNSIAQAIGVSLEPTTLNESRSRIKKLIVTAQEAKHTDGSQTHE